MTHYVHHIPGRLRVRSARVKGSDAAALDARTVLESRSGVRSVETNLVTGSVVIRYDPEQTGAPALMDALRQHHFLASDQQLPPEGTVVFGAKAARGIGGEIAKKVARYAIDAALERSVVALVGALL